MRTSMISYYTVVYVEERKLSSCFLVYYSIVRAGVAATRVAKMTISQGCHSRRVFDFIYVIIEVIGTCMQIFKKIDLKINSTFFIQSCSALFLLQTVHIKVLCFVFLGKAEETKMRNMKQ